MEGFFEVCQAKGLTGDQGVLIPATNVPHLMLSEEVVEAVREGRFHVYSAETIDEGIELLTGVPAGCLLPDGTFEEGTVNRRVSDRLAELARNLRDFMRTDDRHHAAGGRRGRRIVGRLPGCAERWQRFHPEQPAAVSQATTQVIAHRYEPPVSSLSGGMHGVVAHPEGDTIERP